MRGEQRRLAGVRHAHEAGVGQQPQPQLDPCLLAGRPRSANRGAWRVGPVKCRLPRPPRPARATTTRWPGTVRSQRASRSGSRTEVPGGTRTSSGSALAPWRFEPSPWPPRPRLVVRPPVKGLEVAHRRVGHEHHVAAAPAVAAVGAALRHVRLTPERHHAVAAAAALHEDPRSVVEHGARVGRLRRRAAVASGCRARRPRSPRPRARSRARGAARAPRRARSSPPAPPPPARGSSGSRTRAWGAA